MHGERCTRLREKRALYAKSAQISPATLTAPPRRRGRPPAAPRRRAMKDAPRSAIAVVGSASCESTMWGITDASATRSPATPCNSELVVDDAANAAAAGEAVRRVERPSDVRLDLLVAPHLLPRVHLLQAHLSQRAGAREGPRDGDAAHDRRNVLAAPPVVAPHLGRHHRVGRRDPNGADRLWPAVDHLEGVPVPWVLDALSEELVRLDAVRIRPDARHKPQLDVGQLDSGP